MAGADVSSFCLNSDPVSEFVDQIRYQDEGAVSLTGMLAAGLGLLAGLGGGFGGGGGGGGQASDQTSLSVSSSGGDNSLAVSTNFASNNSVIRLDEGTYDDDERLDTGVQFSTATDGSGNPVSNLRVNDDRFEVRDGSLFITKGAEFDYEGDEITDISVRSSSSRFARTTTGQGIELTVTGNGGFSQTVELIIEDEDDYQKASACLSVQGQLITHANLWPVHWPASPWMKGMMIMTAARLISALSAALMVSLMQKQRPLLNCPGPACA